ncbi:MULTISPECIES: XdhC family protein [unclassified Sedimentibacter]|uniref:XdhC family protein n=1 Tax=unclassified Sedimentibacter TaxID=2649220 RepID=UPI0027DECF34|nr:XdhC/CoxI family protein [Sedimentibacter sp. MB35-C1]WMJ78827.1 XdhC family protein [Sedimentibacter sp. MB35-C1]
MEFYKILQDLDSSKDNVVFTYLTGKNKGAKLILSDGEKIYSESNDSVDWKKAAESMPVNKKSQTVLVDGEKIYIEFLRKSYSAVVCGAGHVSIAIIKMCNLMDLPVTVIDDRMIFTNNAKAAGADNVMYEPFEDALDKIEGDSGTFFIIVTRGHRYDQMCLEKIINKENAYIGMIGSRLRVGKVLDYLEEKGVPREKLDMVHTPIGLKIGAETPAEIAVSIMAEIIEIKNKKSGMSSFDKELVDAISGEKLKNIPKAVVTIVSRKGSSPRDVGTKMIVCKDGTMIGTIGGGCVEAELRQKAFNALDAQRCELVKVDMTGQEAEDDGMVCGGIIEVFIDPIM